MYIYELSPLIFSLEKIFLHRSLMNNVLFFIFQFNPTTWINFSFILNFTLSLFSLILHCWKEKKSGDSKYNVL